MQPNRREFLQTTVASGALAGLGFLTPAGSALGLADPPTPKKLRLLILGGTGFLGPHTVEAALARGHDMTLFNRGKTNPHLFPNLEKLHGDRKTDLSALEGKTWDAVIDTSGYVPRYVTKSAELLAKAVQQYVFISSISVYKDMSIIGMDETAAVGKIEDESTEKIDGVTYGPLKALCEQAAEKAMPGRVTNIRPGLIVGPGDESDRFTYWPVRVSRGGEVLAPGSGKDFVQFIDVRDLASWIITCIENRVVGVFNADAPGASINTSSLLETCKAVSSSDARFTWVDAEFLEKQGVQPWSDMPVWSPPVGENLGFGQVSTSRARAAGLKQRPIHVTVKDTLDWFGSLPEDRRAKLKAGISPDREKEVLAAWHKK